VRRLLLWVPAAAVAVVQAVWALRLPDRFADLHVYRGSVLAMRHGGSLYSYVAANGDPFTYPPFAGLVLYPAGWPIDAVWMVLTFGAVVWCAFLVAPPRWAPLACLALLLSAPVVRDLRFGQVSLFLALLVLLDALRWKRGIATGVASAVKLTPLVFVPYLWLAGHRRAALTAVGTFLGCTALAWLVLPRDSVRYWFTELWHTDRIGNLALSGNQSLNGLLLRAGVSSHAVWLALALVVLAVGLWRASRSRDPLTGIVIAGAVCVAVSPVSWTHHQIWLVFAAFCAVGRSRVAQVVWTASVLIVMTVPALVNGRAFLALAIACVVPFTSVGRLEHAEADRRGG
jgi:alpha-1,2-mannosyltransferase